MTSPTAAQSRGGETKLHQQQQQHSFSPVEVAWLFVKRYYTYVNKDPAKLYNFYGSKSVVVHGVEGEATDSCQGQQEIHQKYLDLKFEDCKVLLTNVDSLPSLNGSIFIQVLGELTNRGEPARKFAQSFLLAEQANGYYVLNDVFRYLKDEIDSDCEAEDDAEESVKSTAISEPNHPMLTEPQPIMIEPEIRALTPPPLPPQVHHLVSKPGVTSQAEAVSQYTEHMQSAVPDVQEDVAADSSSITHYKEMEVTVAVEAPAVAHSTTNGGTSVSEIVAPVEHSTTPVSFAGANFAPCPAASTPVSTTRSTWAGIVGHAANKWKKNTISDVKGTSVTAAAAPAASAQASPAHPSTHGDESHPSSHGGHGHRDVKEKHLPNDPNASIYVKNIPADVTTTMICSAFSIFGEVLHCDFNQYKTGAFVDFASVDAAMKALTQREVVLPNGAMVNPEEKRPRGQRPGGRIGHLSGRNGVYRDQDSSSSMRGGRGRGRTRGDAKPSRGAQSASVSAK